LQNNGENYQINERKKEKEREREREREREKERILRRSGDEWKSRKFVSVLTLR